MAGESGRIFQILQIAFRRFYRNCEIYILGADDDRGINADCPAANIYERTAGIARIDGRIRLNESPKFLKWSVIIGF